MNKFVPVLGVLLLSSLQSLAMSLGDCAGTIGFQTGLVPGGIGSSFQSPLGIKDGKIAVLDPKAIVSKEVRDDKEVYRYKVDLLKGLSEVRTLEVSKDANGNYRTLRKDDLKAQKEMAQKLGYYDSSLEKQPVPAGVEAHYLAKNGKCDIIQAVTLKVQNGRELPKEVFIDKKYCESIDELLKKSGKKEAQACVDILDKAQKIFTTRATELQGEGKVFTPFEPGFASAAYKLAYCSPAEFNLKLNNLAVFNHNNAYYNLTQGHGMNGVTDSSAPSMTQGTGASGSGAE